VRCSGASSICALLLVCFATHQPFLFPSSITIQAIFDLSWRPGGEFIALIIWLYSSIDSVLLFVFGFLVLVTYVVRIFVHPSLPPFASSCFIFMALLFFHKICNIHVQKKKSQLNLFVVPSFVFLFDHAADCPSFRPS
jgi:hypothetical protein